jgi:hypothetical protein
MSRLSLLLLALAALSIVRPSACFAEPQCPWMNAATAGGFLGSEVQAKVTGVNEDGDATCEFTRGTGAMLRIAVHGMTRTPQEFPGYLALCGAGAVTLRGIGNQAVHCLPYAGEDRGEELIVGRVRDRVFVITIKAEWINRPPSSPTKTRNHISDDSENIAEQVAGSMF